MEVRCRGDGKAWGTVEYWGVNSANVWDQNNMLQMERRLKLILETRIARKHNF